MDVNLLILAYAIGKITRKELEQVLRETGFHPAIVQIHMMKADYRKSQVDAATTEPIKVLCDTGNPGA